MFQTEAIQHTQMLPPPSLLAPPSEPPSVLPSPSEPPAMQSTENSQPSPAPASSQFHGIRQPSDPPSTSTSSASGQSSSSSSSRPSSQSLLSEPEELTQIPETQFPVEGSSRQVRASSAKGRSQPRKSSTFDFSDEEEEPEEDEEEEQRASESILANVDEGNRGEREKQPAADKNRGKTLDELTPVSNNSYSLMI